MAALGFKNKMIKIFIDSNIIRHSKNRRLRLVPNKQKINWGSNEFTVDVFSEATLLPQIDLKNEELKSEINFLPQIAQHAKQGNIKLITHQEVTFELWGLRNVSGTSNQGCFDNIEIEKVKGPFEYSRIIAGGPDPSRNHQFEFLKNIKDKRFLQLQKTCGAYQGEGKLNSNQLKDAFFVYCAESENADYFLTCDFNLLNQVKRHKKYPPKIKLVKPSELVGIIEET
ncbi:hypothetical protein SAMN05660420_03330 [Desulfuromusa kysingii]|uniref:PIN domain-containing protein n=2 Tax=Desulfuromusa kysingii TaxID=37625 RepID=A0A1H4ECW5_9BACT|nr:hypothetical protein SAMN05660420_03330 [Desulfuromusa kysingii]